MPTFFLKTLQEITERIKDIVSEVLESLLLELYDLEYIAQGSRWLLRIYIDREGGVTIDDCTRVSSMLSTILDEKDIIPHAYILEVSSPGLDRPLKRVEDYKRHVGKLIKVNTRCPYNNRTSFKGRLISVNSEKINIEVDNGTLEIFFPHIANAKPEIEF